MQKLVPLYPNSVQGEENERGLYTELFSDVMQDEKVRNIAVTGSYGVGKSTVIEKIFKDTKNEDESIYIYIDCNLRR